MGGEEEERAREKGREKEAREGDGGGRFGERERKEAPGMRGSNGRIGRERRRRRKGFFIQIPAACVDRYAAATRFPSSLKKQ